MPLFLNLADLQWKWRVLLLDRPAYLNGIPFLVVRAISDKADGSAHMDYAEFEMAAIEHSVKLTVRMIQEL